MTFRKNDRAPSRRSVMKGMGLAAATLAAPGVLRRAYAQEPIVLLTWETYHDPAWCQEWSEANGVEVKPVVIGSVDELFSQPFSGAIQPDVMYIETGSLPRFHEAGLITTLDTSKVPNTSNITSKLDWKKFTTVDGSIVGIPYNWGTQPLMFDADVTKSPDSWAVLWDEKYAGKVNVFDDCTIVFPMIALYIGAKDPFNLTDAEFDKCADALRALRKQVRTIARGFDDAVNIYAAGDAVIGYCQNIAVVTSLQDKGKNFDYSLPKEGTPTWIDCTGVSKKGDRDIVYKFINDNLSVKWQSRFIEASTNNGVLDLAEAKEGGVSEKTLKRTNIPDSQAGDFWEKLVILQKPEDFDRRLQMWNDFKAGTL
ncbi:ABC transporter substrate-binding protein [Ancylobacter mangrovi]|uniref:ABC transporter substrate-binding protein n=1 Tax=Ancylobacter mangrovi TaxID=2972472 RepID=UPI00216135D7|nr:ABC transporter substrate-binding protein [Ancylobacter mangrovi]MCS0502841.1 ABC transporter substrate-binding protein [Ancylobacter mangrovi]